MESDYREMRETVLSNVEANERHRKYAENLLRSAPLHDVIHSVWSPIQVQNGNRKRLLPSRRNE